MPEPKFLLLIKSSTLLSDGAMGTMLHARGVSFEKCFDELNMTTPAAVGDFHREYIEAGAKRFAPICSNSHATIFASLTGSGSK